MIIIQINEKHVEEKILGYITKDAMGFSAPLLKKELYKVVERKYRHPQALEDALIVDTEMVRVDNVPPEYNNAVFLMDNHQGLMKNLMDEKCQE